MDQSDSVALGRLYEFTVGVDVFGEFVGSIQAHIEVGRFSFTELRSA